MSNTPDIVIDPHAAPAADRMEQHHRQQLSAMLDGALAPDQARFLLRRLQHDHELGACWERWQVYGDAMRGHCHALLPVDFAERVGQALHAQPAPADAAVAMPRRGRALRWAGGGALAASVALVALIGLRPEAATEPVATPVADTVPATTAEVAAAAAPIQADASTPPADAAVAAGTTVLAAAAAAVPVVRERGIRQARRSPAGSSGATVAMGSSMDDADMTAKAGKPQTVTKVADAGASAVADLPSTDAVDPFAAPATSRPWPRSVLPGLGQGAFNANSFDGSVFAPYPALRPVSKDAPAQVDDKR